MLLGDKALHPGKLLLLVIHRLDLVTAVHLRGARVDKRYLNEASAHLQDERELADRLIFDPGGGAIAVDERESETVTFFGGHRHE